MRTWFVIMLLSATAQAEYPSGRELLEKIDENMASETRVITSSMVIHGRRSTRTVKSKTWAQEDLKAYTEYLAPAREKGTKMLKLSDRLWLYSPTTDRIVQISGHMLRQSVMGSDLSYEDMMENPRLLEIYDANVTKAETVDDRPCWVVQLVAKKADVAYHTRTLWVDQARYVPLRETLYAKSGKLLKKTELGEFKRVDDRWFPWRMVFKDVLKKGKGTELLIESIEFDVPIPKHLFSKAALRR
jgi:outer membrane lipoprotein-sorting protein